MSEGLSELIEVLSKHRVIKEDEYPVDCKRLAEALYGYAVNLGCAMPRLLECVKYAMEQLEIARMSQGPKRGAPAYILKVTQAVMRPGELERRTATIREAQAEFARVADKEQKKRAEKAETRPARPGPQELSKMLEDIKKLRGSK